MTPVLERRDRHGTRVHVQFGGTGPHDLASHQSDRVGTDRAGRAHGDHPRRSVGMSELLVERAAAGQSRQHPLDDAIADGQFELHAAEPAPAGVLGDQACLRRLADDDPRNREHQSDGARAPADEPDRGGGDEHREPPAPAR